MNHVNASKMRHFIVVAMCFFTINISAQLKVASNGNTAFATTATTILSPISVGYGGNNSYLVAVSGSKNGILSQTTSTQTGFRYAGLFTAPVQGIAGFNIGVFGEAVNYSTSYSSGRSYGVYGQASNATSGFNYGVFGSLKGSHNGAAVYGTTNGDDGTDTGDKYAGYFYGKAKVTGTLYVNGGISGTLLSKGFSSACPGMQAESVYGVRSGESAELASRLSTLELVAFSQEPEQNTAKVQNSDTDTIDAPRVIDIVEKQASERLHYALPIEQLEASFPELVYVQEDGSKAVNYVELVPVLVQCINELSARVGELEGGSVKKDPIAQTERAADGHQERVYYPITVDGKAIGTKRGGRK
jgi:hypothetical protein